MLQYSSLPRRPESAGSASARWAPPCPSTSSPPASPSSSSLATLPSPTRLSPSPNTTTSSSARPPKDFRSVILAGLLPGLLPISVVLDNTSSRPALARQIYAAARGISAWSVDTAVSGGDVSAREGRLAIFAGGDHGVGRWLDANFEVFGRVYIIYMGSLPKDGQYSKSSQHLDLLQQATGSSYVANSLVRSYKRSFNGFAANLTKHEKQELANMKEVVSIFPNRVLKLQTTRSWDFMGFHETISRNIGVENDIIVGVIDTGI